MEITLEQLLAARDARVAYTKALQTRFPGACVAVFSVVTPGSVKRSPETIRLFDAGVPRQFFAGARKDNATGFQHIAA